MKSYLQGWVRGPRERRKEGSRGFSHYRESSIPSRNLLVPYAGQQARGVGQQTRPAPVASAV